MEPALNFNAFKETSYSHKPRNIAIIGGAGIAIGIALTVLTFIRASAQHSSVVTLLRILLFVLGGAALIYGLIGNLIVRSRANKQTLQQFLSDNGFKSSSDRSLDSVATSLLSVGTTQQVNNAFEGVFAGVPFTAVSFSFMTSAGAGSGGGPQMRVYTYTNLKFNLAKTFPLLVLDDERNNTRFHTNLRKRIEGSIELQVEGNFGSRFSVWVLPESQQDVLQLLTPSFMQELMDNQSVADIEIQGNELFVIVSGSNFSESILVNLFSTAKLVLKSISEISNTWQASSPATVDQMAAQAVAPRLKQIGPQVVPLTLRQKVGLLAALAAITAFMILIYVLV